MRAVWSLGKAAHHLPVAADGGEGSADGGGGAADGDCCGGLLLGAALDGLEDVGLGVGRLVNPAYVPLQVVRPRKGLAAVLEFKFFIHMILYCPFDTSRLRIHQEMSRKSMQYRI